jgi:SAM-dependent methyltransferase
MHSEAYTFVGYAAEEVGSPKAGLELGAYNVNGSARELFPSVTRWYGIDLRPGENVDEVANAETWMSKKRYDLVLCTEVLEHAQDPEAIVETAYRHLRKGGFFVMTCAAPGRAPHTNDGAHGDVREHYENVSQNDMYDWLEKAGFDVLRLWVNTRARDLYALARR